MKVTIVRTTLLAPVKRAASIVSTVSSLDQLRGVLVEADSTSGKLTLSATNLETSLKQMVPCTATDDGAFIINAQLLNEMLPLLEGDTVEFQREDGQAQVTIHSGEACFNLPVMERGAFPETEIPFPEDTVKVSGIPAMARRSGFAVGRDPENPQLGCINLRFTKNGLRAVGSDGSCMVSAKGDDKSTGNIELLVPAASLLKLARMCADKDEFFVGTTGKQIVFFRENFVYSARLMDGEYINTDGVLTSLVNSFTVLTDVTELKQALNAATALSPENAVQLTFAGNKLHLRCNNETGDSVTSLDVIPLTGAPQGEYWFISRQLSGCLHALTGAVTLGIAQGGMLTLSANDAFYMQTGLRPQVAKVSTPKKAAAPERKAA